MIFHQQMLKILPVKILAIVRNVTDSHLTNIVNKDAKNAFVRPLYKKNDHGLNGFSKVHERYLLNSLSNHIKKILSNVIAAYRKTYSSSHVLIRLIENWKNHLDNKKIVWTVAMDLSKTFDYVLHCKAICFWF